MARSNTWKRKQAQRRRRRERRRAARQAKRDRPLASEIRDPFEVVLRVLMARGLPLEVARKVVFNNGEPLFASPTARMMKEMAISGGEWASGLDVFEHQHHHAVTGGNCMCQAYTAGEWASSPAALYCCGMNTEIGRATPISVAAACHSQTIYQWRGTYESQHYKWITENHDWERGQLWEERWDDHCGMAMLYYRFWRTMNDRTDTEEMPIMPREYSLVRQLKEADMYNELQKMFRDATGEEYACLKLLPPRYTRQDIVRAIIAAN